MNAGCCDVFGEKNKYITRIYREDVLSNWVVVLLLFIFSKINRLFVFNRIIIKLN